MRLMDRPRDNQPSMLTETVHEPTYIVEEDCQPCHFICSNSRRRRASGRN